MGWMYVVLLMALTETSWTAGIVTFVAYGVFPLAIIVYLGQTPARRKLRRRTEAARDEASAAQQRIDPDQ